MTDLVYMRDGALLQTTAQVVSVGDRSVGDRDGKLAVVLDRTILYPQGGGQPADQGEIVGEQGTFAVTDVRYSEGTVYHFGIFTQGSFGVGDTVTMTVNAERRALHSRIHSAGHVLDEAVTLLGYQLKPGKGYHFPEGPYVEYEGMLPEAEREQAVQKLQDQVNRLVAENLPIATRLTEATVQTVGGGTPATKSLRFMKIGSFAENPCGGTHVATTGALGMVTITKVKCKGGVTRISYSVA
jgi:Ser-tRNA(Ala) deacylase AlaX